MICQTCRYDKPETNFAKRTGGRKRNLHCRKCIKKNRNQRGLCMCGNPQKKNSVRCERCLERHRIYAVNRRSRDRTIVLNHYGQKCVYCGEDHPIFLTIDHIDNGGAEHRRAIGRNNIYKWLRQQNFPSGFQVACYNCNCAKHVVGEQTLLAVINRHDAK